jgi:hypothetical protein
MHASPSGPDWSLLGQAGQKKNEQQLESKAILLPQASFEATCIAYYYFYYHDTSW